MNLFLLIILAGLLFAFCHLMVARGDEAFAFFFILFILFILFFLVGGIIKLIS